MSVVPRAKVSSASLHHPLLVKFKYWWISIIDYSPIITWWFCSGYSISLRARRCFCQQLSCTGLAGTRAREHKWHSALCTISHASCSTGIQLSKPNTATQRWQIPSCSKLYWKLHALKDPYPSANKRPSLLGVKAFQGEINLEHSSACTNWLCLSHCWS